MNTVKGLVFFDLDGTLLDDRSDVTIEVSQAMGALQENGFVPIIATGRTNFETLDIAARTGIDSLITMNGQHIVFAGEKVFARTIPTATCQRMHATTQSLAHELGYYTAELIRVTGHTPVVESMYDFIHAKMPDINPHLYDEQEVNMMLVLGGPEHDAIYKEQFPDLKFYRNSPYSIDVISQEGSKGQGVKELVRMMGLEGVPRYAFGDGMNDLELFKACDYRIAMGNACAELKDIATYVTSNNTDGGILRGLRQYNLID